MKLPRRAGSRSRPSETLAHGFTGLGFEAEPAQHYSFLPVSTLVPSYFRTTFFTISTDTTHRRDNISGIYRLKTVYPFPHSCHVTVTQRRSGMETTAYPSATEDEIIFDRYPKHPVRFIKDPIHDLSKYHGYVLP